MEEYLRASAVLLKKDEKENEKAMRHELSQK